jgi:hypothetical protein
MQIFIVHGNFLFNRKYGRVGLITMPYVFFFEFLAPIIEGVGIIALLYFLFTGQVNFNTAYILFGYLYLLAVAVSLAAITFDIMVAKLYNRFREYLKLIFFAFIEVFIYHPFIVFFSIKGYIDFMFKQKFEWGAMKRQGFERKTEE